MAINAGNADAMCRLGNYYYNIKDYENMMKFYLMAIKLENKVSMYNMGFYYHKIRNNHEKANLYFMMSYKAGDIVSLPYIEKYFESKKDYVGLVCLLKNEPNCQKELIIKYLELFLQDSHLHQNHTEILDIIANLDFTNHKISNGLSLLSQTLKSKIDLLDLHFKYAPDADGYKEAKEEFYSLLTPKTIKKDPQ